MALSSFWIRINSWSKRKAIELEAKSMWRNGMLMPPEGDFLLALAHREGRLGNNAFMAVVLADPEQRLHDTNHLSLFRAFGRHAYADHWAEFVKTTAAPRDVLGVNTSYEELFAAWSNIEHAGFWQEAGKRLNTDPHWKNGWENVLEYAGYNGNVLPFDACVPAIVRGYAKTYQSVVNGTWSLSRNSAQYRMLHPDVAHWFVDKGWWQTQELQQHVNERTFPLCGESFMGWTRKTTMSSQYVVDTCQNVLGTYGLNTEQTVRFVGQAFLAFGPEFWDKALGPALQPFMQGVDMDVLRTVCGDPFYKRAPQADRDLFDTLHRATHITQVAFDPQASNTILRGHDNAHPALMMLMDFQPPQDRFDLYCLGVTALQAQRGLLREDESLALPSLDAGI